jgi:hypothetical protein
MDHRPWTTVDLSLQAYQAKAGVQSIKKQAIPRGDPNRSCPPRRGIVLQSGDLSPRWSGGLIADHGPSSIYFRKRISLKQAFNPSRCQAITRGDPNRSYPPRRGIVLPSVDLSPRWSEGLIADHGPPSIYLRKRISLKQAFNQSRSR